MLVCSAPTLWSVASLTFSLVHLCPPLPAWISTCILGTRIRCIRTKEGGYGVLGLREINTCRKINFLDDDILHCHLWVLSFFAWICTKFSLFSFEKLYSYRLRPCNREYPSNFFLRYVDIQPIIFKIDQMDSKTVWGPPLTLYRG